MKQVPYKWEFNLDEALERINFYITLIKILEKLYLASYSPY